MCALLASNQFPRRWLLAPILVLALLLASGFSIGTSAHGDSPVALRSSDAPAASARLAASTQICSGPNSGFSGQLNVTSSPTYTNSTTMESAFGLAPMNLSFNLTVSGLPINYTYNLSWGDRASVVASLDKTVASPETILLMHEYTFPADYFVSAVVNYTCQTTSGANESAQWVGIANFEVYGAAGPNPLTVTANVTAGPVPLNVTYTAVMAGLPANATIVELWTMLGGQPHDVQRVDNLSNGTDVTNVTTEYTGPGAWAGSVNGFYNVPGVVEGLSLPTAWLPTINVTPLALVSVTRSTVPSAPPYNVTFSANVTNLSGGSYLGPYTVNWSFYSETGEYGPTTGASVWQQFNAAPPGEYQVNWDVNVVRPDGVTIGLDQGYVTYTVLPPTVNVSITPSGGTAPLFFNFSVGVTGTNLTEPLHTAAWAWFEGINAITWYDPTTVWWANDSNFQSTGTFPGELGAIGTYLVVAQIFENLSGSWWSVAQANVTVNVTGIGPAPALSFSASPSSGSAPLNLTLSLVAVGGTAPYVLAVCTEGPLAAPNDTGPCTPAGSATEWSGSALALSVLLESRGNYTIVATVTDSIELNSTARASVLVTAPAPIPPLSVQASAVAPNAISSGGATFEFFTSISGGVAPFDVQWTFGDGTSGSATPGSAVQHTYLQSGRFTATLSVTDARGQHASSTVGPLVVSLPLAPGSGTPWWGTSAVLGVAAIVGVGAAGSLAWTLQRLARRKEALNWLREVQDRGSRAGSQQDPK